MKVKQLIDELMQMQGDSDVEFYNEHGDYEDVVEVERSERLRVVNDNGVAVTDVFYEVVLLS